jgi:ribosomal protein RSM22 (predicted rRNA methylase)
MSRVLRLGTLQLPHRARDRLRHVLARETARSLRAAADELRDAAELAARTRAAAGGRLGAGSGGHVKASRKRSKGGEVLSGRARGLFDDEGNDEVDEEEDETIGKDESGPGGPSPGRLADDAARAQRRRDRVTQELEEGENPLLSDGRVRGSSGKMHVGHGHGAGGRAVSAAGHVVGGGGTQAWQPGQLTYNERQSMAYAAFRLPAAFAAVVRALSEVREHVQDAPGATVSETVPPRTMLDFGSGPGTAILAALDVYGDILDGGKAERRRARRREARRADREIKKLQGKLGPEISAMVDEMFSDDEGSDFDSDDESDGSDGSDSDDDGDDDGASSDSDGEGRGGRFAAEARAEAAGKSDRFSETQRHSELARAQRRRLSSRRSAVGKVDPEEIFFSEVLAVEPSNAMQEIAKGLLRNDVPNMQWKRFLFASSPEGVDYDLVTATFSIGELETRSEQQLVVDTLWKSVAPGGVFVMVEPGTPAGFTTILAARAQILARRSEIIGPCPHSFACPVGQQNKSWCHFSQKLQRVPLTQQGAGKVGFEDSKFSWVAFRKPVRSHDDPHDEEPEFVSAERDSAGESPLVPRFSKFIWPPMKRGGHVVMDSCDPDGSCNRRVITKRHGKSEYKAARDCRWGDEYDFSDVSVKAVPRLT